MEYWQRRVIRLQVTFAFELNSEYHSDGGAKSCRSQLLCSTKLWEEKRLYVFSLSPNQHSSRWRGVFLYHSPSQVSPIVSFYPLSRLIFNVRVLYLRSVGAVLLIQSYILSGKETSATINFFCFLMCTQSAVSMTRLYSPLAAGLLYALWPTRTKFRILGFTFQNSYLHGK